VPTIEELILHVPSGALDIALAAILLRARLARPRETGPGRLGLADLLLVAAAVGVFAAVRAGVLLALGVITPFGAVALAYVAAVITGPLVGLGVAMLPARRATGPARLLGSTGAIAMAVGAYASFVEPMRFVVEESTVAARVPTEREPIRVVALADIESTRVDTAYHERVLEEVARLAPDVILIPGDLAQGPGVLLRRDDPAWLEPHAEDFRAFLSRLDRLAPAGAWMCEGNTDDDYDAEALLAGTGVGLLLDEWTTLTVRGRTLAIGALAWTTCDDPARAARVAAGAPAGHDTAVLMAHTPDAAARLPENPGLDLVVSGHTHGGQVVVPGLGPPFTCSVLPRRVAAGGLHTLDNGVRVYVSRGVGVERGQAPAIRLFCPPEISLLTLR
jgi:predicted MPP superfamily phosphohydrolase